MKWCKCWEKLGKNIWIHRVHFFQIHSYLIVKTYSLAAFQNKASSILFFSCQYCENWIEEWTKARFAMKLNICPKNLTVKTMSWHLSKVISKSNLKSLYDLLQPTRQSHGFNKKIIKPLSIMVDGVRLKLEIIIEKLY